MKTPEGSEKSSYHAYFINSEFKICVSVYFKAVTVNLILKAIFSLLVILLFLTCSSFLTNMLTGGKMNGPTPLPPLSEEDSRHELIYCLLALFFLKERM